MATKRADCAMTPGAMKSRKGRPPEGMARIAEKVSPKTTNQSAGWIARVYSSVRSWRILATSTQQKVRTRLTSKRGHAGSRPGSAHSARGTARCPYIFQAPSFPFEMLTGVVAEHILQGGLGSKGSLELRRRAADPYLALVHQCQAITQMVRFFHVVGGEEDRGSSLLSKAHEPIPNF